MSSFASKYPISKPAMKISVKGNQMDIPDFRINSENQMVLQTEQVLQPFCMFIINEKQIHKL